MDNATADSAAQDITDLVESRLYGSTENESDEPDDVVEDEAQYLERPDASDDSDSGDEDSDEDLDEVETSEEDEELNLADQFGIPEERLKTAEDGKLMIETIVDGEKKDVPLKDLVVSYQLQGHVNKKSMALEEERKALRQERETVGTSFQQRFQELDSMQQILEGQIVGEYNSINWDELRNSDPAEYTALRQDFSDRARQLQIQKQQIAKQAQENQERISQENQAKLQEHLQSEFSKLIEKNPEWKDEQKYKSDMSSMKSFVLEQYGFTEQDIDAVVDHRLMGLIKDAYSFRKGKQNAEQKKVNTVPKFQKPGSNRTSAKNLEKARAVKAKRSNLKKNGSVDAAASLLMDRI